MGATCREVEVEKIMHCGPVAMRGNRRFDHESKRQEQQLIAVQLSRPHPQLPPHRAVAIALADSEIDAARKQSGKKDEPFGCREKSKRLINICAQDRRQMSACDPHQHQAAKGIEFF
jgi:hypothetical protein